MNLTLLAPVSGGELPRVIKKCMNKIYLHFFALSEGNSLFKRADSFFKQDKDGKVWLLWNNSNRIELKNVFYGQKNYISSTFFSNKLNMRPLQLEKPILIPECVEIGATYDSRRPNQLSKDLVCQNCGELRKHTNFSAISYKYLIQSREMKSKEAEQRIASMNLQKQEDMNRIIEQSNEYSLGRRNSLKQEKKNINIHSSTSMIEDQNLDDKKRVIKSSDKISIPQLFQKIHPKLTDFVYERIKNNPKFYSKQFWVCQICYLELISCLQQESGTQLQIDHKQILESVNFNNNKERKPRQLRKEFTKFQQECFNLFLDENKYQQAIWQNCSKQSTPQQYYKQKKLVFKEQLELQQIEINKKLQQSKIIQKNAETSKLKSAIKTQRVARKNRESLQLQISDQQQERKCQSVEAYRQSTLDNDPNVNIEQIQGQKIGSPLFGQPYQQKDQQNDDDENYNEYQYNYNYHNNGWDPSQRIKEVEEVEDQVKSLSEQEEQSSRIAMTPQEQSKKKEINSSLRSHSNNSRVLNLRAEQIKAASHLENLLSSTTKSNRTYLSTSSQQQNFFRSSQHQEIAAGAVPVKQNSILNGQRRSISQQIQSRKQLHKIHHQSELLQLKQGSSQQSQNSKYEPFTSRSVTSQHDSHQSTAYHSSSSFGFRSSRRRDSFSLLNDQQQEQTNEQKLLNTSSQANTQRSRQRDVTPLKHDSIIEHPQSQSQNSNQQMSSSVSSQQNQNQMIKENSKEMEDIPYFVNNSKNLTKNRLFKPLTQDLSKQISPINNKQINSRSKKDLIIKQASNPYFSSSSTRRQLSQMFLDKISDESSSVSDIIKTIEAINSKSKEQYQMNTDLKGNRQKFQFKKQVTYQNQ